MPMMTAEYVGKRLVLGIIVALLFLSYFSRKNVVISITILQLSI